MLGKTQKEMANILNISSQSYHNKENGSVEFRDSEKIVFKNLVKEHFPNITLEDIFF